MERNRSAIHTSSWFVFMVWSETQCTVLLIMVIDQEVVMQMNLWNFTNKELAIQLLNLHTWYSSFKSHWNPILSRRNCSFRTYGVPVFFSETERPIFRDFLVSWIKLKGSLELQTSTTIWDKFELLYCYGVASLTIVVRKVLWKSGSLMLQLSHWVAGASRAINWDCFQMLCGAGGHPCHNMSLLPLSWSTLG
jgi:hypothetical protein